MYLRQSLRQAQKVSPTVIGKNLTRVVGEQIYPENIEMPERGMAPVLQIGRMTVPAAVDAESEQIKARYTRLFGV